jgi:phosphotransferase system HPr (HPr) family protein
MIEKKTRVGAEEGLHARPAAQFVKTAKGFSSEIVVVKGDKEANAKSSMKIMTLAAKKGDEIVIRAEGEDAQVAVDALVELISQNEH